MSDKMEIEKDDPRHESLDYVLLRNLVIRQQRIMLLTAGGLIAISIVVLQAFLPVGGLDIPETISVYSLAIDLPMLAGSILFMTFVRSVILHNFGGLTLFIVGSVAASVGIGAALYHISWVACALFAASALVTGVIFITYYIKTHGTLIF